MLRLRKTSGGGIGQVGRRKGQVTKYDKWKHRELGAMTETQPYRYYKLKGLVIDAFACFAGRLRTASCTAQK
jgi:hypothetical protein